jgi:hypothetical protein
MNIIDLLVDVGIVLTAGYCVVLGFIQVRDQIRKNRRG